MVVLVIGGSGSGKSSYAEEMAVLLSQTETFSDSSIKRYYLATMQVFDEEGRQKVNKHRRLRANKGFVTIEQPTKISRALEKMELGGQTVLLECISNLTANEMFSEDGQKPEAQVTDTIIRDIELLKEKTMHFVIVSNNIFEDGIDYGEAGMDSLCEYVRAMGKINRRIAGLADRVVEVAAGIPIIMKE